MDFVIFLQKISFRDAKPDIADSGGNNFAHFSWDYLFKKGEIFIEHV